MNCSDAEKYMMKYMDGEMTENEAKKLNVHLLDCPECKHNFLIYEQIMDEIDEPALVQAPPEFEHQVMAKIIQISETEFQVHYHVRSKIWGQMWGAFTVIFGTGTVIAYYKEPIMLSLSKYPHLYDKISKLAPVEQEINMQGHIIYDVGNQFATSLDQTLSHSIHIILLLLAIICGAQYYLLHRKNKMDRMNGK